MKQVLAEMDPIWLKKGEANCLKTCSMNRNCLEKGRVDRKWLKKC